MQGPKRKKKKKEGNPLVRFGLLKQHVSYVLGVIFSVPFTDKCRERPLSWAVKNLPLLASIPLGKGTPLLRQMA